MRALHVTSPLMSGQDVSDLQTHLRKLNYTPGPIDGKYGPSTASAVAVFERANHLVVDKVWDAADQACILHFPKSAPPHPPSSPGKLALAESLRHLGVRESPDDSNRQPFGAWFGVNGVAWCNIFASYCFEVGAHYQLCHGFHGAGVYAGKGCTYVPTTEAWLRATGMWLGRVTPIAGDIAIYNWDGGVPDHIGIVESYLGGGKFNAIEGNTGIGNDSNGGEVMRRLRYITNVDGFGRVR